MNYPIKLANIKVGLLINFNVERLKEGIKRFVFRTLFPITDDLSLMEIDETRGNSNLGWEVAFRRLLKALRLFGNK